MNKIRFSVKKTIKYDFGKTGENNIEEDLPSIVQDGEDLKDWK